MKRAGTLRDTLKIRESHSDIARGETSYEVLKLWGRDKRNFSFCNHWCATTAPYSRGGLCSNLKAFLLADRDPPATASGASPAAPEPPHAAPHALGV